jgi:type I restriction enzyme S subunit
MAETLRLGDHCEKIGSGATPRGGKETYSNDGPVSLIRSQNVYNDRFSHAGLAFISDEQAAQLQNVEVKEGDVLLNITGDSVARVCQVDRTVLPARVNQHVAIIRTNPARIDARFLRYFLVTPSMQAHMLALAAAGATRNALTKSMIEGFRIPACPVVRQRAVASILGALDDKIDHNRRMNETLEAMARVIFKDWFVDFGPTRAKAEGRTSYLAPEIWALFPNRLDDEGKPEGWGYGVVSDIGDVICGKTPSTAIHEYYGHDVPFITIPDMHGRIFALNVAKKLSHSGAASQSKKTLPAGAICVSCIATPGLVVITTEPSQTNQQINSVVPFAPNEALYWFWILKGLGNEIRQGGSGGSVLTNLSTGRFMALRVLHASKVVRAQYHVVSTPIFERIAANERECLTLAATRDFLLPKLMSGEIRLREAERALEAAL